MKLALTAIIGDQTRLWPIEGNRVRIGRARSNAVQISASSVSREHAELVRRGERLLLRDLRSTNGTWLNGVRIRRAVPVCPGDQIQVGRVRLSLSEQVPEGEFQHDSSTGLTQTVEVPVGEIVGTTPGNGTRPGTLVRLLEKATRLFMQQKSLRHTCEEFLQAVRVALPCSQLTLLLRPTPEEEPAQIASHGGARDPATAAALTDEQIHAVLERKAALFLSPSAVAVPVLREGRAEGLLVARNDTPQFRYSPECVEILTLFANVAAMRVTGQRLQDAQAEIERVKNEMHIAGRIQRWLLTGEDVPLEGYDLHARIEPCEQVGGDFYDVQPMPDGTAWLILGDVSGKGVGAAIVMSLCLSSARVLYDDCGEPGALASRLNTLLTRWTASETFVTAFIGKLMPDTGTLRYVNAGHVPPLILGGRKSRQLESTGMLLGYDPKYNYRQSEAELAPGSLLALYSDGVLEAKRGEHEIFGDRRVERALRAAALFPSLEEAARFVVHEVDSFRANPVRDDDLALLLLRRAAAPERRKP